MNSSFRRVVLTLTVVVAVYVGAWAELSPASFSRSFPGLGLMWISIDGPFNEHLIRDVGALYLGFAVACLAAIVSRRAAPARAIGLGWSVFGILHLGYHALHPEGSAADQIGTVASLAVALLLGILLIAPARASRSGRARRAEAEVSA